MDNYALSKSKKQTKYTIYLKIMHHIRNNTILYFIYYK